MTICDGYVFVILFDIYLFGFSYNIYVSNYVTSYYGEQSGKCIGMFRCIKL